LQKDFLEQVVTLLDRLGVTYGITGSIASNYWGIPRFTHDLDVLIVLDADQARQLAAALPAPYYVSEQAAVDAVRLRQMFNVIDPRTNFKGDFWVSAGDAFSESVLSRRQRLEVTERVWGFVASPEDVLLHKLVWNKITPSERQLADAAGIAAVQAGKLDEAYMRGWAARQSTSATLEEVLQGKYLKET
jgi:hypothetical protein